MNFFERIPTSWLLTGAAVACLLLWAGPGWAQSADDPAKGKLLFEDTTGQAPDASLTHNCTNCHGSVQNRRTHIAGSNFADISFDTAMSHFGIAIANNAGGQMGQYTRLDAQQVRDIAAYIADTPKTSAAELDFVATAVNTNTLSQTVDLTNAATSGTLTITGVAITGTGAARFTSSSDTCSTQTLPASGSCRVAVRFTAPDAAAYTASLTMTMRVQGSSSTFTRDVPLSGQVNPPAPMPAASDEGGGALGPAWLAGLAMATLVLARRRRG
ncbi:MAG: choice-of-anchor D domain-containing protein [Rhizobacter sp.]|nr:choice-of-anchor D domain-containing protein [Rhizobacter sp.]